MASKQFKLDKKLLKSFEPFSDLSTDKLDELAEKSLLEDLPTGRTLFRQGERDKRKLFLVAGQIDLSATDGKKSKAIKANTADSNRPLCDSFPRPYTGKTKGNTTILTVDADLLEIILDDTPPDAYQVEVTEIDGDDTTDWMLRFLQSRAFLKLPTDNIQAVLMRMEEVPANEGDVIIQQGKKDDYYYIVQSGECAVLRRPAPKAQEVQIATLKEGDGFGEEALITNGKRNATIKMQQDGILMRINKRDFLEYLAKPLIDPISSEQATSKLNAGSLLIDVRHHEECASDPINGAVNIPLSMLRLKTAGLNPDREYVLVCDDGSRSAAAAFLMTQQGLNVSVLQGGLSAGKLALPDSSKPAAPAPQPTLETKRTKAADKTQQAAEHRAEKISKEANTARQEAEKLAKQTAEAEAARRKAMAELKRLQQEAKKSARVNTVEQQAALMKKQAEEAQSKAEAHLKKIANARKANEQKQKLLEDSLKRAKNIATESAKAATDARRQAEKEAEEIRLQAMAEAEKLRQEMEKTRQQFEQQSMRSQAEEQASLAQARKQAEATVKETAEHARRQAEEIRRQALEDAEKLKAEIQATRMQVKQQANQAEEAERQKRLEILEQTRLRAEELAQKTARQAEMEADEIRRQAIEEAEQLRAELENTRKLLAEQAERAKAEQTARARVEQEEQARHNAQLQQQAEQAKERARLVAEEQRRHEAEQREQEQLDAERERRRQQAIKNAQMKTKEQARKMAEQIKAKMEQAEKTRQEEEARQRGDGISLSNATIKRSKGKIILEGDEDIFIFKEPNIKAEDIEAELEKLDIIEEKDELPSFEVEEEEKPVFTPVNTQAISLKLEQQASDNKQQRKKRRMMALAASFVLAIGGGVTYLVMNPALLDTVLVAKAKPTTATAKASLVDKLPSKNTLDKAAKRRQEKKKKSEAKTRFEELLQDWKQLTSSDQ